MAVAAVSLRILPCPFCQNPVDERESVVREAVRHGVDCLELQCNACGKSFTHYRQLTRSQELMPEAIRAVKATQSKPKPIEKAPDALSWVIAAGLPFLVDFFAKIMAGPSFLALYAAFFIAAYAQALGGGLRKRFVSLFSFELLGGLRLHHALSTGHHNTGLLGLFMVVGVFVMLIEWDSGGGSGGSGGIGSWFGSSYDNSCHRHHHHCSGCGSGYGSGGGGSSGSGGGCGGCGS